MKRLLHCISLVFFLAACQQTLDADVTRYYGLPPLTPGQTFAVVPDPDQAGNLEFQHYAAQVAGALQATGLQPVAADAPSDLVVQIHYGNAGSRTLVYSEPTTYWGAGGAAGPGWWGSGAYFAPAISNYVLYSQYIDVSIYSAAAWRSNDRHAVFQGRALGDSNIRDINTAMPYLIKALFQNFPGANGQTVRTSVAINR